MYCIVLCIVCTIVYIYVDSIFGSCQRGEVAVLFSRYWPLGRGSSRYSFVREVLTKRKERASAVATELRGVARAAEPTAWTLKAFVKSRCFIYGMMSLICLNLILLGIEAEQRPSVHRVYKSRSPYIVSYLYL